MRNATMICLGLAAAFALAGEPALAQMYSWKDPATGQSRLSNIAPPWYRRGEQTAGPRVIALRGNRIIDDTALPYDQRLALSGKARIETKNMRPQGDPRATAPQQAPKPRS